MGTLNSKGDSESNDFNIDNIKVELIKLVEERLKKNDEKKSILTGLKYALDNQINWQKYAEAKCLILCTVSATTLINLAKYAIENKVTNIGIGLDIFLLSTTFSFIISALSLTTKKINSPSDGALNISYWRYVKDKKYEELLDLVKKYDDDHQIKDLTFAHLKGSEITYKKYIYFNRGMYCYLVGLVAFIAISFVDLIIH